MKYVPTIAGTLLGLVFAMASVVYLLKLGPQPNFKEGSPEAMFLGAFGPTGWFTFVKICELLGAILIAIPRTRNFGLLVLGPITVNILAFHICIKHGEGLLNPIMIAAVLLALYLLWVERSAFAKLVRCNQCATGRDSSTTRAMRRSGISHMSATDT